MSPMGMVLGTLVDRDDRGAGPIEVMLRVQDFGTPEIRTPQGSGNIPAQMLIAFEAESFRRVAPGEDVWEFSVDDRKRLLVAGADILFVRVSRLVG